MSKVRLVNREGPYAAYIVHNRGTRYMAAVIGSSPKRLGVYEKDGQYQEIEVCPADLAREIFGAIGRYQNRKPLGFVRWIGFTVWAVAGYAVVTAILN